MPANPYGQFTEGKDYQGADEGQYEEVLVLCMVELLMVDRHHLKLVTLDVEGHWELVEEGRPEDHFVPNVRNICYQQYAFPLLPHHIPVWRNNQRFHLSSDGGNLYPDIWKLAN